MIYKIIKRQYTADLEKETNQYLSLGWDLHGDFQSTVVEKEVYFYQAITKKG